jgi:L-lactate dehydrogenase complex protein LldG
MVNEETGNGFFSRLKNVFSSSASTGSQPDAAFENSDTTTLAEEKITADEEITTTVTETLTTTTIERAADITEVEISLRTVEVSAPPAYTLPTESDLDIRFATKFIEAGGKFVFCETIKQAVDDLKQLKEEKGWSHIFCWENEIKDAFCDSNFQKGQIGFTIENSDAAVSLCEFLAADAGTIILNPKQASRRRLTCFPKTHIIITDIAHLAPLEADALDRFKQKNKGELPSVVKLGTCNTGHFYDKQRLILNADGPEDIYVFLVDEIIPPSLRP